MSTQQLLKSLPKGIVAEPDIAYRPGESKAWRLDLVRPEQDGAAPRPAIVFVHGGGWRSGDKRRGYFIRGAVEYAQKGYVCASVNYRLVGEAKFPACIEDVKCAVRWLRANAEKYNVDPQRIGGYGNSAGAHLVAMLGLAGPDAKLEGDGPYRENSSLLQAVCCSATPTDLSLFGRIGNRRPGIFAGPPEMIEQQMRQASPITYAGKQAPPFLVVHGTADKTVDVKHGDTFVKALKDAGAKSVEYLRIDGAGHGVFGQHAAKTHPAMEKFFAEHLQGKLSGPSEKER
jgi:acetyl esterase/lipase